MPALRKVSIWPESMSLEAKEFGALISSVVSELTGQEVSDTTLELSGAVRAKLQLTGALCQVKGARLA